jgi:hypothetical protein
MMIPPLFAGGQQQQKKTMAPSSPPARLSSTEPTTSVAQRQLLAYKQLKDLVLEDNHPYLGNVPDEFQKVARADSAELKAGLDWLAAMTQSPAGLKQLKPSRLKSLFGKKSSDANPLERLLEKNQLKIKPLGGGIAGNVFQLQVQDQDFALKVFTKNRGSKNVYRESATGLFFTEQETQDLSKFYASNPLKNWTLMEFIPPNAVLAKRPGTPLSQQGVEISDDKAENRVQGIRVDHGGVVKFIDVGYMADDEFKRFSKLKAERPPSVVMIDRPDNLAAEPADWNSFEEMCDKIPIENLITMHSRGKMIQDARKQSKTAAQNSEDDDSDSSTSQKSDQRRTGKMPAAALDAPQTEDDIDQILDLYKKR